MPAVFITYLLPCILPAEKLGSGYTANQDQDEDPLLDAMSILEINAGLACHGLSVAREAFTRMFKHFFPGPDKTPPETFETLGKVFLAKEDPALGFRWAATKTGIESTIALVSHSKQSISWEKVAVAKGLTATGFTSLLKSAKKYSRAILNLVDPTSTAAPSATPSGATHTEVQ